jgi:rhamnulokinase
VLLARHDAERETLAVEEVHRFANGFVHRDGHDCWDVDALVTEINAGLEAIIERGITLASVGIDTWGVDFVLLDADGKLLGQPIAYRDHRTDGVMARVFETIPRAELYARTGIQFLQFNTIFQLAALKRESPAWLPRAHTLLLMADYLHYRLCGVTSCEYTNASTTQLLNLETGDWDDTLLDALDLPRHWFQPLTKPGTAIGHWQSKSGAKVAVITPATHDTGAAVVAIPLEEGTPSAYISSGTWSLMGIESRRSYSGAQALAANFTNEGGVDGTYRVLKNIMGLWLLQRVRDAFPTLSFAELVQQAEAAPALRFLIDPNDDRFLNPPSMLHAIQDFCSETGQAIPESAGEVTRCILESLAFSYRRTLHELHTLTGESFEQIHIVGGGCQNRLLNQMCADFCNATVHTGPIEAAALGNVTCQLRTLGKLADLAAIRHLIRKEFTDEIYRPDATSAAFADAHWTRFKDLCSAPRAKTPSNTEGALHE